jgi:hypothetical protein
MAEERYTRHTMTADMAIIAALAFVSPSATSGHSHYGSAYPAPSRR